MANLCWTDDNLHTLGKVFLWKVLDNLRDNEGTTVRFGQTGEGIKPNYEITFANGRVWVLNGASHDTFPDTSTFDPQRVSTPFTRDQVKQAVQRAA